VTGILVLLPLQVLSIKFLGQEIAKLREVDSHHEVNVSANDEKINMLVIPPENGRKGEVKTVAASHEPSSSFDKKDDTREEDSLILQRPPGIMTDIVPGPQPTEPPSSGISKPPKPALSPAPKRIMGDRRAT
jgi:hypothetical protein